MDERDLHAIENGRKHAREVLEFRARVSKRAEVIGTAGILVAEGDSWFDYPRNDVLRLLEDNHGYDVRSLAHRGDRIEEMAYSSGQLEELTRLLGKLHNKGERPKAILFSGGGNDVAGKEFGVLLNHARSPEPGLNENILEGVIDHRARLAYVHMIGAVTEVCTSVTEAPVPIIVHGYDYPVPDGRGFAGGWWLLPGPWLDPGFREKCYNYEDMLYRIELARQLIDRFNEMLRAVAELEAFPHVHYVNLRRTLSRQVDDPDWWTGELYKAMWENELHPTPEGFDLVAERFAAVLREL
jgi:lysophospholipase L1-like esterase